MTPGGGLTCQALLATPDVEASVRLAVAAGYRLVSDGVVALPDARLGYQRGALVRDPDGHVVAFVQP